MRTPRAVASMPATRSAAKMGIACALLFIVGKSIIGVTGLAHAAPSVLFTPSGPLHTLCQTVGNAAARPAIVLRARCSKARRSSDTASRLGRREERPDLSLEVDRVREVQGAVTEVRAAEERAVVGGLHRGQQRVHVRVDLGRERRVDRRHQSGHARQDRERHLRVGDALALFDRRRSIGRLERDAVAPVAGAHVHEAVLAGADAVEQVVHRAP